MTRPLLIAAALVAALATPAFAAKTVSLPGGLTYIQQTPGKGGAPAKAGDTVYVTYVGSFPDGKVFDQTGPDKPFSFVLGQQKVIACWEEGVLGMKFGETRKLTCPPALAYGERGAGGGLIPPNATLQFVVTRVPKP